jgi:uncharacterized protein (TIGR02001 family)
MRFKILAVAFVMAYSVSAAQAQTEIFGGNLTGNVHATSDYVHRGISRSDQNPSLGADLTYAFQNGIYGALGANLTDFRIDGGANYELTPTIGFKNMYTDRWSYDVGLAYTVYPGADNSNMNYWEAFLNTDYNFDVFTAGLEITYSPDYIYDSGNSLYYALHGGADLPYDIKGVGHLGFQFVDDEQAYVTSDYMEWGAGLRYNYQDIADLKADYTDTNLDDNECRERCGARITVGVGKAF